MKKKHKVILWVSLGITLLFILVALILVLALDWKWTLFWIVLSIFFTGWLILGIVLLVKKLKKAEIKIEKIDPEGAIAKIKEKVKQDHDNPDNLQKNWDRIRKMGRKDKEPTPVLIVVFLGSEKGEERCFVVNLNNPNKEIAELPDGSGLPELIVEANAIADYPEEMITEERKEGFLHGMPQVSVKRTIPSSQKARDEALEKEKEDKSAI